MTTPTETKAVALPEKKRLFDLAGNHWEEHAFGLACNTQFEHSGPYGVDVRSYLHAGVSRDARALVAMNNGPLILSMSLGAAQARQMAKALLAAADRVDEVNFALVAEKAAAKLLGAKAKKAVAPATKTLSEVCP